MYCQKNYRIEFLSINPFLCVFPITHQTDHGEAKAGEGDVPHHGGELVLGPGGQAGGGTHHHLLALPDELAVVQGQGVLRDHQPTTRYKPKVENFE